MALGSIRAVTTYVYTDYLTLDIGQMKSCGKMTSLFLLVGLLYVQFSSIGKLILVQGSVVRQRKCGGMSPLEKPAAIVSAYWVRLRRVCVFPRRSCHGYARLIALRFLSSSCLLFYSCFSFGDNLLLACWPHKRLSQPIVIFFITSGIRRNFRAPSAILFTETELR